MKSRKLRMYWPSCRAAPERMARVSQHALDCLDVIRDELVRLEIGDPSCEGISVFSRLKDNDVLLGVLYTFARIHGISLPDPQPESDGAA